MPAKVAHHAVAVLLGMLLDGGCLLYTSPMRLWVLRERRDLLNATSRSCRKVTPPCRTSRFRQGRCASATTACVCTPSPTLSLIHISEPLGERLGCFPHHLTGENIADSVHHHFRLFVPEMCIRDRHSIVLFEEDGYSGKSSRTNIVRRLSEWHSNNN